MLQTKRFLLFFCLAFSCMGCGPLAIALGIAEGTKSSSSNSQVFNNASGIIDAQALDSPTAAPVTINYKVVDQESNPVDVTIEFSSDGGNTYQNCTPASGSEGVTGLSSSPSGKPHSFLWDYTKDFGGQSSTSIKIRITPQGGIPVTINNVRIGNTAPSIIINISGTQSGNIAINYSLIDLEGDTCSIVIQAYFYQFISGTYNWVTPTQGSGGDGLTSLVADSSGINHTFIWDSVLDQAGRNPDNQVQISIQATDSIGATGTTAFSSIFTVDNSSTLNFAPSLVIQNMGEASKSRPLKILYTLKDDESNPASIEPYWSNDGSIWNPCKAVPLSGKNGTRNPIVDGDDVNNLSTSSSGILHSFVWDVPNESALMGQEWILIKLVPKDSFHTGSEVKARIFLSGQSIPQTVFTTSQSISTPPSFSFDSKGILHAVWSEDGVLNSSYIYYSRFDGSQWTAPQKIFPILTYNNSSSPALAIDRSDNIYVVWQDKQVGVERIFFAKSSDGGQNFSTPQQISYQNLTYKTDSFSPHILIDSKTPQKIYVFWQRDGELHYRTSSDGGSTWNPSLTSKENAITFAPSFSSDYDITLDNSDNLYLVWGNGHIYFTQSSTGGITWDSDPYTSVQEFPKDLTPVLSINQGNPTIGVDSQNRVFVAYNSVTNTVPASPNGNLRLTIREKNTWTDLTGPPASQTGEWPKLGKDGKGNIYLVWKDRILTREDIFYSVYNGNSWSPKNNLSNSFSTSSRPSIAIDGYQNAHVLWVDTGSLNALNHGVIFGNFWAKEGNLPKRGGNAHHPSVVVDGQNHFYAVWEDDSTGNGEIFFSENRGDGWTAPVNLTNTTENSQSPSLFLDSSGNLHLVWMEYVVPQNINQIFYKTYNSTSGWSSAVNISSTTEEAESPQVLVNSSGTVFIFWRQSMSRAFNVVMKKSNLGFGNLMQITNAAKSILDYHCVLDSSDNLHLVWQDNNDIYYSWSGDNGTNWLDQPINGSQGSFNISNSPTNNSSAPRIAVDSSNTPYIVWQEQNSSLEIYFKKYTLNWSGTSQNISNSPNSSEKPQILVTSSTVSGQEKIYIVYQESLLGKDSFYFAKSLDQGANWTNPYPALNSTGQLFAPTLIQDKDQKIRLFWSQNITGFWQLKESLLRDFKPLFYEDLASLSFPSNWSVVDENNNPQTGTWTVKDTTSLPMPGMTGNYFYLDSSSNTFMEARLVSPVIDCSKAGTVYLEFNQNFAPNPGRFLEEVHVEVSADGGATWNPVIGKSVFSLNEIIGSSTQLVRLDISHYASGQSQVKIRFRFVANNSLEGSWALDNIKVMRINSFSIQ